jgi:hypothetical protein
MQGRMALSPAMSITVHAIGGFKLHSPTISILFGALLQLLPEPSARKLTLDESGMAGASSRVLGAGCWMFLGALTTPLSC